MKYAIHIDPKGMSAPQILEAELVFLTYLELIRHEEVTAAVNINIDNLDDIFEELEENHDDYLYDNKFTLRESGKPSGIRSDQSSRHYEFEEVAYQTKTGHWVGWTYWHGGGKHGEPEDINWMPHAYFLNIVAEKQVIEYEFERNNKG